MFTGWRSAPSLRQISARRRPSPLRNFVLARRWSLALPRVTLKLFALGGWNRQRTFGMLVARSTPRRQQQPTAQFQPLRRSSSKFGWIGWYGADLHHAQKRKSQWDCRSLPAGAWSANSLWSSNLLATASKSCQLSVTAAFRQGARICSLRRWLYQCASGCLSWSETSSAG